MLLPPVHMGMTIDVMPYTRSNNIVQDILIHGDIKCNTNLSLFKFRFLPSTISICELSLSLICKSMIQNFSVFNNVHLLDVNVSG